MGEGLLPLCLDDQADKLYNQTLAIMGVSVRKELAKKISDVLLKAGVAKASGCMVNVLLNEKDPELLRATIQAELREFRGHVGKHNEKKLLNGLVWDKLSKLPVVFFI